nr:MAG TPA: hypothetical protein [Caudoviricetes sp.]
MTCESGLVSLVPGLAESVFKRAAFEDGLWGRQNVPSCIRRRG